MEEEEKRNNNSNSNNNNSDSNAKNNEKTNVIPKFTQKMIDTSNMYDISVKILFCMICSVFGHTRTRATA